MIHAGKQNLRRCPLALGRARVLGRSRQRQLSDASGRCSSGTAFSVPSFLANSPITTNISLDRRQYYWYCVVTSYLRFEWHDAQDETKLQAHGVKLRLAGECFNASSPGRPIISREE